MNVRLKRAKSKLHERKKHDILVRGPDGRYPPLTSMIPKEEMFRALHEIDGEYYWSLQILEENDAKLSFGFEKDGK